MIQAAHQAVHSACEAAYIKAGLLLDSDLGALQSSGKYIPWDKRIEAIGRLRTRGLEMVKEMISAANGTIAQHGTLGMNRDGWPGFLSGEALRGIEHLRQTLYSKFDPSGPLGQSSMPGPTPHQDEANIFNMDFSKARDELAAVAQKAMQNPQAVATQEEKKPGPVRKHSTKQRSLELAPLDHAIESAMLTGDTSEFARKIGQHIKFALSNLTSAERQLLSLSSATADLKGDPLSVSATRGILADLCFRRTRGKKPGREMCILAIAGLARLEKAWQSKSLYSKGEIGKGVLLGNSKEYASLPKLVKSLEASSLEGLFVRNAIDPTVDEKELIANLEQLALSTAITISGARGKMPDPSLESKRFFDALASLKSEYESILYRILLYDGPNGTECLRGWVVFDDLPVGDLNVGRIDLGPCTYVEWREPLDPGIATLANRLTQETWSLPHFRRTDESKSSERMERVPKDWKFNVGSSQFSDGRDENYSAYRLYVAWGGSREPVSHEDQEAVSLALTNRRLQSFNQFFGRHAYNTHFQWDSGRMIEIYAPIRVRVASASRKGSILRGSLEMSPRGSPAEVLLGWQTYENENDTTRGFHEGAIAVDPAKAKKSDRVISIPFEEQIGVGNNCKVLGSYRGMGRFSHYARTEEKPTKGGRVEGFIPGDLPELATLFGRTGLDETDDHASSRIPVQTRRQARVFVGHSFSAADRRLAERIKRTLTDTGAKVVTGERADADRVSDKVKKRINESDVFVGIFTRRHRIRRNRWTTSPWVVDEKGYALGRGLRVILLVESHVPWPDETGGLQGDIEHLTFARPDIGPALRKLKEIIQDMGLLLRPPRR